MNQIPSCSAEELQLFCTSEKVPFLAGELQVTPFHYLRVVI